MGQNIVMGGMITLKCKDLRIIALEIKYAKDFYNVSASLEALSAIQNPELDYPFFYRPMYSILEDGYTMFRCVACSQVKSVADLHIVFFLDLSWNSHNYSAA